MRTYSSLTRGVCGESASVSIGYTKNSYLFSQFSMDSSSSWWDMKADDTEGAKGGLDDLWVKRGCLGFIFILEVMKYQTLNHNINRRVVEWELFNAAPFQDRDVVHTLCCRSGPLDHRFVDIHPRYLATR